MFTEFKELFSRHGRLVGHEINAQCKEKCVPKQQNERHISLQLQNSVGKELENYSTYLGTGFLKKEKGHETKNSRDIRENETQKLERPMIVPRGGKPTNKIHS